MEQSPPSRLKALSVHFSSNMSESVPNKEKWGADRKDGECHEAMGSIADDCSHKKKESKLSRRLLSRDNPRHDRVSQYLAIASGV